MTLGSWVGLAGVIGVAVGQLGCRASTTRPPFGPKPMAATAELRLGIESGTQILAEALQEDSIPIATVELLDGYVETRWFRVPGWQEVEGEPVGVDVVRVRGWVDPARPGYVRCTVEIVYRPWVDPSRDGRELDVAVPSDHLVLQRVQARLKRLVSLYGDPDPSSSSGSAGT